MLTTYSVAGCKIPSDVKAVTDFSACDQTAMKTHKKTHENPGKWGGGRDPFALEMGIPLRTIIFFYFNRKYESFFDESIISKLDTTYTGM